MTDDPDHRRGHGAEEMRQPGVAVLPHLRSASDADDRVPAIQGHGHPGAGDDRRQEGRPVPMDHLHLSVQHDRPARRHAFRRGSPRTGCRSACRSSAGTSTTPPCCGRRPPTRLPRRGRTSGHQCWRRWACSALGPTSTLSLARGARPPHLRQRVEQGLRLLQICGVKAFGEPGITRRKEITSFMRAAPGVPRVWRARRRLSVPRILPLACCASAIAALRHCSASLARWSGSASNISALKRSISGSYHRSPVVDAASSAETKSASAPSMSPAAALARPTIPIRDRQVECDAREQTSRSPEQPQPAGHRLRLRLAARGPNPA